MVVILLVFGTKKLRNAGSDLGAAVKGFKKAMSDDEPKKDAEFTQIKDGTNTAEKTETVKDKEQAYSYLKYAELIDEILKNIIAKGKGLELNMAGLKYGLPYAHPHPDVLKRYRELGGEIITVGADGHCPEHIAWDFDKANGILRACGFTYYTEFKQRKPVFKQLS